jgi:hypothetical protein
VQIQLAKVESESKPYKEPAQQVLFPDLITTCREGRDELNLAEFPISANYFAIERVARSEDEASKKMTAMPSVA